MNLTSTSRNPHANKFLLSLQYIVEMQVANQKGFEKRAQYYAAKAYISQMNKGDKLYKNLKEVIFLAIVDFKMFPESATVSRDSGGHR